MTSPTVTIDVKTWEGKHHSIKAPSIATVRQLKEEISIIENVEAGSLRIIDSRKKKFVAKSLHRRQASILYEDIEFADNENISDIVEDHLCLLVETKHLSGWFRGGVCPHMERSASDFDLSDRSPWARHKYRTWWHLVGLRIHGYAAISCWVLFSIMGLSVKGSIFHVIMGRLTAYINLPISMCSGLYLFRMLFERKSHYENIMKTEGPATILVFSIEMILTWLEAVVIPTAIHRVTDSTVIHITMIGLHLLCLAIYWKISAMLIAAVRGYSPRTSEKMSALFDNAIELYVLVVPMAITNLVAIPVHFALLTGISTNSWKWRTHHKLYAVLLPYIAMPGTTLVLGRDAYWIFHPDRMGTLGLHNLRDRLLVQNVPIVIYLAYTARFICSAVLELCFP